MSVKFTFTDVYIGDQKDWRMTFTDTSNQSIDLSNRTIYFTAKIDKSDLNNQAIIRKEFLIPETSDSQNGIFTLVLSSSDTTIDPNGKPIEEGSYHCDFRLSQMMQPTVIYNTVEGIIEIEKPVTDME